MSHMPHSEKHDGQMPYVHLAVMLILNFIAMYVLMYSMVDTFGSVYASINQVYMAALMTAPMTFLEVIIMRGMYPNHRLNWIIAIAGVVALILFFGAIRAQTAVGDTQFVRSMIPHHSGAILMCERANITDAEIKQLCQQIISSQQTEIDQMRAILDRLRKS